jgi:hypothetical protein
MGSQRFEAGRRGGKRQRRTAEIRHERDARWRAGQGHRDKQPRGLLVGGEVFQVSLGHEHREAEGWMKYRDCTQVLTIRRHGAQGRLRIVFQEGPGRLVPDGGPYMGGTEVGTTDGRFVNLAEPGTQLAVLDEARKGGWQPDDPSTEQIDGWSLFDAVAVRRNRNSYE